VAQHAVFPHFGSHEMILTKKDVGLLFQNIHRILIYL